MTLSRPYDNIFEALEDDPAVAESLRIRSEMMIRLRDRIAQEGISPEEAAWDMGVTGDSIKDLMSGKIDRFTIDSGIRIRLRIFMIPERPKIRALHFGCCPAGSNKIRMLCP